MINRLKQYDWKRYNISLLCVVIVLCLISALAVYLAGGAEDGMSYMKSQLFGMGLGLFIVAFLSMLDYHFVCQFSVVYYIVGILLTAATHSPLGTNNNTDAVRWIKLGSITFQPSELMNIILIITLATLFSKFQSKLTPWKVYLIACILTIIPVGVIMTQPDLSSSLVSVFILIVMIFVAGISYRFLVPVILLGIPIGAVLFWYIQQPGNIILHGYHYDRVIA